MFLIAREGKANRAARADEALRSARPEPEALRPRKRGTRGSLLAWKKAETGGGGWAWGGGGRDAATKQRCTRGRAGAGGDGREDWLEE
jgi:hypothetical protein